MNVHTLSSDLRRYRKAGFSVAGSRYEVTGTVRAGYSLWLISVATVGSKRELIATFSTLHAVVGYIEDNASSGYNPGRDDPFSF